MPTPPRPHALLEGKTALVTAAAGAGIGVATAKRLLEEGARVAISDRHERRLAETAEQLAAETGSKPFAVPCDVTVEGQVQTMFDAAIAEFGGLDIVVNNAGLGGTADLVDMTDEQWDAVIQVSLYGTFRCTRAAMRHMIPRRSGAIVNLASILAWRAQAGQAHYAAAKAGVAALTRAAALEGAPHGVRVNAVAPSLAVHPFLAKVMPQETLDALVDLEAFKRGAETWEVATVIAFLASDYAGYMTGETVSVSSQHP